MILTGSTCVLSVTHSVATEPCEKCAQALPSGKTADVRFFFKLLMYAKRVDHAVFL